LQFRVFGLGGDEDRDVGIGVLPESEEILISLARFGGIHLQSVGAGKAEAGEGSKRRIGNDGAVVDELLKFRGGIPALVESEKSLAANIERVRDAYLTVIDSTTGQNLWSASHVWRGLLTGKNSVGERLVKKLEKQIGR
jgi:hypothetical protein